MKQKMTSKLKELFPNLGLTDSVLDQVSGVAIVGLSADADDALITERARAYEGMLKAFQSDTDRRVNDAVKRVGNKGGEPDPKPVSGGNDDIMKMLKEMKESGEAERKTLLDRIAALEGKNAAKTFDEQVAKVAGELGLPNSWLAQAKLGLSSDMDEAKMKESLGAFKKFMADSGAAVQEQLAGGSVKDEEAARAAAKQWVDEHAVKE